jgi:protein O-GlcNAc transferase
VADVSCPDHRLFLVSAQNLVFSHQYDAALSILTDILRREPDLGEAWLLLARLQLGRRDAAAAEEAARRAATLLSGHADAHYISGRAHDQRAQFTEAAACYRRALQLEPFHINASTSLAIVEAGSAALAHEITQRRQAAITHVVQGQLPEALAAFNAALEIAPDNAELWLMAGTVAMELGMDPPRLLPFFEAAERLDPSRSLAVETARAIRLAGGIVDETTREAALAQPQQTSNNIPLDRSLFVPAVPESDDQIRRVRERYEQAIDQALRAGHTPVVDLDRLRSGSFFLAYHGRGNRVLHTKLAQLHLKLDAGLAATAAGGLPRSRARRLRIGFISRNLAQHSIGKTTRGLIEQLDRERFESYAIRICPSVDDQMTRQICGAADREVVLDKEVGRARSQIEALDLDVLFYQDIGLDPTAYRLAFSRLARVQCLSFGHPDTTGIPNMDYFVSSDLYELPQAQSHYSEKVFLLRNLPTLAYYYRPARAAQSITRERLGIPSHGTLYACPQALFKFHPDFDGIMRGILVRDPHGVIVLIRGAFEQWTQALRRRFARSMPEVAQRVVFLPALAGDVFLELLAMADVVLDPIHFNGMNSSLECFSVGTPVVTLPTELQRGRHTQAMYRSMGIADCIARSPQDYVDIAVRIGTDVEFASRLRERILAHHDVLFENARVVREFERFFTEVAS